MIHRMRIYIVSILMIFTVICFGQEMEQDSTTEYSYSALDSAYTAVIEQKPDINISLILIKIFWIFITIFISVLLWRYVLRPVVKMVFSRSEYQDEILTALKFLITLCISYLILMEIISPTKNIQVIIIATACLGFALAAREYLRDIISGIVLLFNHYIKRGDKIKIEDMSGELINIGLKSSVLKTQNDTNYIIPNHILTQNIIRRKTPEDVIEPVNVFFYLPSYIDIIKVKEITHRVASLSQFVYLNKPINLTLTNEYHNGRSILKLQLTAFVLNAKYSDQFISDTTENVITVLLQNKLITPDTADLSKIISD